MAGYSPLKITGMTSGLVQEREEFILPDDAYPVLENAFVWRERIKRKQGALLLGRLRRIITATSGGNINLVNPSPNTFNLFTLLGITGEPNAEVSPGTVARPIIIVIGAQTLTDNTGVGTFTIAPAGNITAATIVYSTGVITITFTAPAGPLAVTITLDYYPGLPVMGLRPRQLDDINNEQLIAFDQKYAYIFGSSGFQEFIPGTTWTGNDSDFFWSTNYWVGIGNTKIFWVTNFSGTTGDPIRYTNSAAWINFAPLINAAGDRLQQCLALLPFRGRLLAFNTLEGATLAGSVAYFQRIRWSAIGNPFTEVSAIVTTVSADAWKDDIRGKGGFLDIPTSENIVAVGFVRDNLVIYCESSTWQLRYTGRSISPFQIEKVNTELGAESTFSAVQFDTSLVGIGDKGIVECDSYKSDRIDVKIPDLVFNFHNVQNGQKRIHGIRDFQQRIAYWTYPFVGNTSTEIPIRYPNRRLVYNYENDSWAIYTDSLTALGTYQKQSGRTWEESTFPWSKAEFTWIERPSLFPDIIGGNQQGVIMLLDEVASNDVSLSITNITGNTTTVTVVTSVNHNLVTGQVIQISQIPLFTPFYSTLNNQIFSVVTLTANTFEIYKYNPVSGEFDIPQLDPVGIYVGGGKISVRDNFSIKSKKFNFIDEGQQIQFGYLDILMNDTASGAISMYVYMNYNDTEPVNTPPQNVIPATNPIQTDSFFNTVIPTNSVALQGIIGSKNWNRIYCNTRAQFITIEYTLSNLQMIGIEQESDVQIDAQILWIRPAGRLT